ncbi:MAG: DmsC/YnfH family molybdoenzyme membrane anchor subunit [bacterium]|nr:4Fe-4S dicluster domain-containing protein [Gammaproteobacteria bacterium]HIL99195.1 4Fe-4S dicluster domain-containing protein [Pseudomonadales bacterium]
MAEQAQSLAPGDSTLWERRDDEQSYALLYDPQHKTENRYGQKIDLLDLTNQSAPAERPLYINDNTEVGCNPNRNKQHGFFFTADNCIGCHACEAACAEKNETPAHLAFRSVGYIEGGSYPDYQRLNISMACNHCDDPVCLKGCPTGAYTKHAEYGAVLQDPDTCFGCGYCTWVCPYNAPQLDPIEGQVSKCNMCVDRLEVGLKPACVSACLGNALDFGVIENIPANREEAKTTIPGFPDPEITHPNIRFQQTRGLPEVMTRTDSNPVKYHREGGVEYLPVTDEKQGKEWAWNWRELSSRENVLVAFTLLSQTGIGAFSLSFVASATGLIEGSIATVAFLSCALVALALFMSTVHLGKPLRFYRGFNNLKYSPVAREGLGVALFLTCTGLYWLLSISRELLPLESAANGLAVLGIASGAIGLYYMVKCYRIPARPFWDHWQVATSFVGCTMSIGGVLAMLSLVFSSGASTSAMDFFGACACCGIAMEAIGLYCHGRDMTRCGKEGAAAHYVQTTRFGKTYWLRNMLIAMDVALTVSLLAADLSVLWAYLGWGMVGIVMLVTHVIGRSLFYVLVIPTTIPGAFFWKNPAFEDHARDVGLAEMPQVGIVPHSR